MTDTGRRAGATIAAYYDASIPPALLVVPTLTALVPDSAEVAAGDVTVSVQGTEFSTLTKVVANGQTVASAYVSPTELTVTFDPSAVSPGGAVDVEVRNGLQRSTSLPFTFTGLASLTAVTPASAVAGSPARSYVVDGADFAPDVQIEFDGAPVPTQYMTPTSAATGNVASRPDPGTVAVRVRNGPTGTPSNELTIDYTGPSPPVLDSIDPTSRAVGPGDFVVRCHGSEFTSDSVILFGDQEEPTTFVNSAELTATVSGDQFPTADVVSVLVRTPNADPSDSNNRAFTFTAALAEQPEPDPQAPSPPSGGGGTVPTRRRKRASP